MLPEKAGFLGGPGLVLDEPAPGVARPSPRGTSLKVVLALPRPETAARVPLP